MTKRVIFIMPLTMIGLVIVLVGTLLSHGFGPPRSESEIALAFSCGYRAGQISTMNDLPALFKKQDDIHDYCVPFRELAIRRGFKSAAVR